MPPPVSRTAPPLYIRWGVVRDTPEILAIDTASFAAPWDESDFRRCLRQRNCISMVAESARTALPVGYMLYELYPDHLRLLKMAVRPDDRRRGIARVLFAKLVFKCCSHQREFIAVTVPASDLGTHLFLLAVGCTAVGVNCGRDGDYQFEYRPSDAERERHGFGRYVLGGEC